MKLVSVSVDTCSQASMTFTDPLLQQSPQSVTFCAWQPALFGNETTKIPCTSSKLPHSECWTFRKQAVSSPVLRPLKSDTQLILQHFKLQEWYRDQKLQVFFSIEIVLFQNGTGGSIEYIHVNWPCHQPTFAGETLMNIHHRKLLRMSWHMSLLLPMLNLILKRATLEFLIHSRASSSKFFFRALLYWLLVSL